jgi:hypothetical protein
MPNTIRLRRGSGVPTAGSFVEGEPAWDSTNGNLYIKNAAGTMVQIGGSGGTPAGSNGQVQFNNSGAFGADVNLSFNSTTDVLTTGAVDAINAVAAGASNKGVISVGALSFTGARIGAVFESTETQYFQVLLQNTSNNTNASCDFVVCNDASTDSANYGNFGINSSTYSGTGIFNQPGAVYLTSTSAPLGLGTTTDHDIRFSRNSEATDSLTLGANDATFGKTIKPRAGTATANTAPLAFTAGTNLTTAVAGVVEYDGTHFYSTPTTTSGRGQISSRQTFRLAANGANVGPTIGDYFGATSAINLAANSVYDIEILAFLLKNSAGTLTWTLAASSAPTLMMGVFRSGAVTGLNSSAATITTYTGYRNATTAAFAATASITAGAYMAYEFNVKIITNLATTFKLQVTNSAGTVTPQAGSFYTVRQIAGTTGSFA